MSKKALKHNNSTINNDDTAIILKQIYALDNTKDIIKFIKLYLSKSQSKSTKKTKKKHIEQGHSGSTIYKTDYNTILKKQSNINIYMQHIQNKCYSISPIHNELLINNILKNYKKFIKTTPNQDLLLDKCILKIINVSLIKKNIYIELPYCHYKINNKNYSTLNSILVDNFNVIHTLFLKKQYKIIETFDTYLTKNILLPIIKTLKILQQKIKFIHSDLKLRNIFINQIESQNKNTLFLKSNNLYLDFDPLLADFDKSSLVYNDVNIIPYNSPIKSGILRILNRFIIEDTRHKCQEQQPSGIKKCQKYTIFDIDNLTMFINLYLMIYNASKRDFIKMAYKLPTLKKLTQKMLKLDDKSFLVFLDCLKQNHNPNVSNIRVSKHISYILYKFCKTVNKS